MLKRMSKKMEWKEMIYDGEANEKNTIEEDGESGGKRGRKVKIRSRQEDGERFCTKYEEMEWTGRDRW